MDRRPRAWLVVPAMGIVAGALAFAVGHANVAVAIAAALTGAAIATAVRAVCGDSPAALVGAVVAALLGCLGTVGFDSVTLVRASLAGAAAVWTIAELTTAVSMIELVALASAVVASVLDPSFAPLIAITGARLVTGRPRRRWGVAVIAAGGLVVLLAVVAGLAHGGALASLWRVWSGGGAHELARSFPGFAARVGDALGPIAAVAAIAGVVVVAGRGRWAALAIAPVVACSLLVGWRGGEVGAGVIVIAALASGVAIARLAALVRLPAGQVALGVTAGAMLLLAPTWAALVPAPARAPEPAGKVATWRSSMVTRAPRRGPARRSRSVTSTAFTSVIAR